MKAFSVIWSPYNNTKKYPIGILVYSKKWYFKYNNYVIFDAINQGFRPFPDLSDIKKEYISDELFPTFLNRYNDINIMHHELGQLETDKILIKYINEKEV